MARRPVAAALTVAALALAAGCGSDDAADDEDGGAAYAGKVEAIMTERVDPAGVDAIDELTNIAQGETDLDGVLEELDRAAADLRAAEDELGELDPPESMRVPAEELTARIGVLADRLDGLTAAELERDPLVEAENVHTDLNRIVNRELQITGD